MVLSHSDLLVIPSVHKLLRPSFVAVAFQTDSPPSRHFVDSHPFRFVCQGYTLRYPNPYSPHVITSDVLERSWDALTGTLRTTRLVLKRGTLPSWAPRGIIEKSETWVLEESVIDLVEGTMVLSNRNLDHRRVMEVVELLSLRARGQVTEATSSVQVKSSWGFYMIRRRIEQYGVNRFQRQSKNSRRGLQMTIQLLQPSSPLRVPLLNAETINYPSTLAPPSTLKGRLRELRLRAKEKQKLLSEMLRGGNMTEPGSIMGTEEDGDMDEESLTEEEEAELRVLEKEFDTEPAGRVDDQNASKSPGLMARWFWWWRWHLCSQQSSQSQSSDTCCQDQPGADVAK